jgi:hypothetical protein
MFSKWCFVVSPENKKYINGIFNQSKQELDYIIHLKKLINHQIPWVINDKEAISTAVFTIFGIYCYCLLRGVEINEECFQFVLLYVNLDYALDDKSNLNKAKEIIKDIDNYLNDKLDQTKQLNEISKSSIDIISRLESKVSREQLKKTFFEEVNSVKVQSRETDLDELRRSCFYKSKVCIDFVSQLVGVEEKYSFSMGKCLQLFDDLFDIDIDRKQNIFTYTISILEKNGNVDQIVKEIIDECENIKYCYVKIFFYYSMVIYCSSSPYVSEKLLQEAQIYYPFDIKGIEKPRIKELCLNLFNQTK